MTREEHAARTQRGGGYAPPAVLPAAPLLAFDEPTQSYRWLGDAQASSDEALLQLDAMHFARYTSAHGGLLGGHGSRVSGFEVSWGCRLRGVPAHRAADASSDLEPGVGTSCGGAGVREDTSHRGSCRLVGALSLCAAVEIAIGA